MEKIFQSLHQYDVVVNIIPGVLFCQLTDWFYRTSFMEENVLSLLAGSYIFGMLVGRIGSLIIEPLYEKIQIIHKAPYSDWLQAKTLDNEIESLTTKSTVYRTLVALFVLQTGLYLYLWPNIQNSILSTQVVLLIFVVIIIGMSLAYRKQVEYVRKRAEYVLYGN